MQLAKWHVTFLPVPLESIRILDNFYNFFWGGLTELQAILCQTQGARTGDKKLDLSSHMLFSWKLTAKPQTNIAGKLTLNVGSSRVGSLHSERP